MNSNNFSKSFTYFNLFFYMGMVISYTVMPLYFKEENSIVAYGFAYSSMALAGALSLFYGKLIDKYDWKKTIIIGTLIYGFAIFGRLLTDVYSSIFFGFMAGLGASVKEKRTKSVSKAPNPSERYVGLYATVIS